MSNPAFAANDARIMGQFAATGMADEAIYTAPSDSAGTAPNCTVMIDRDIQVLGDLGEVVGYRTVATFLRSEVAPAQGGTLKVGAETWTLEKKTGDGDPLGFAEWVLNG